MCVSREMEQSGRERCQTVAIQIHSFHFKCLWESGEGEWRVLVDEKWDFIGLVSHKDGDASIAYTHKERGR